MEFLVTRAYLNNACDQRQWDLLDRLLECVMQNRSKASWFSSTEGSIEASDRDQAINRKGKVKGWTGFVLPVDED